METVAASLSCSISVAWCVERLVRGHDARWALVPLATAVVAWGWLWSVREPTAGRALLAFTLADLAVLAIGLVAVIRLLGGFGGGAWYPDDDGRGDPPDDPDAPPPGPGRATARRPRPAGPRRGAAVGPRGPRPTSHPPHPHRPPRRPAPSSRDR